MDPTTVKQKVGRFKSRHTNAVRRFDSIRGPPVDLQESTTQPIVDLMDKLLKDMAVFRETNPILETDVESDYLDTYDKAQDTYSRALFKTHQIRSATAWLNLETDMDDIRSQSDATRTVTLRDHQKDIEDALRIIKEVHTGKCARHFRDDVAKLRKMRNDYNTLKAQYMDVPATTAASSTTTEIIKLETMPVPQFHGKFEHYRNWKREMESYLKKLPRTASESDRLSYIKRGMKHSPGSEAISNLMYSGTSEREIFHALDRRYDNAKLILNAAANRLMNLPRCGYNARQLAKFHEEVAEIPRIIDEYGDKSKEQLWTILFEHFMDEALLGEWESSQEPNTPTPKVQKLRDFLFNRSTRLLRTEELHQEPFNKEKPYQTKPKATTGRGGAQSSKPPARTDKNNNGQKKYSCAICHEECARIFQCNVFKSMSVTDRMKKVKEHSHRICTNCLNYGHLVDSCRNEARCSRCDGKHHQLLHQDATPSSQAPRTVQNFLCLTKDNCVADSTQGGSTPVKMTAMVRLFREEGDHSILARAVIDPCSDVSFVSKRAVTRLGAALKPSNTIIRSMQGMECQTSLVTNLIVANSSDDRPQHMKVEAAVYNKDCQQMPRTDVSSCESLDFARELPLADPTFAVPGQIDLLIGVEGCPGIITGKPMLSTDKRIAAVSSIFGWMVYGACLTSTDDNIAVVNNLAVVDPTTKVMEFLGREDLTPTEPALSTEDEEAALQHFEKTIKLVDGRYQVSLPRRGNELQLGRSKGQALSRLQSTKRQLQRKGTYQKFQEEVLDYESKAHSEEVPYLAEKNDPVYYLPMHGVVKESSSTTKLRIVFDASAKTSNGLSLNDNLLPGPNIYPLLPNLLIKFRTYAVALTADVHAMFRQILLDPRDKDLHRYLTFDADSEAIRTMRMNRLTFGVTSSPFLATMTIRQMAKDNRDRFPEAASVVKNQFYVDDGLTGRDTVQEAIQLRVELSELFADGAKMLLRKWRTNSPEVLDTIPIELREKDKVKSLADGHPQCQKTLGLYWNTEDDSLYVATPTLNAEDKPTKRQVSSDIARIYDILGLYAPITITLKLLLQHLWTTTVGWDDIIETDDLTTWERWRSSLHLVRDHPIQRFYFERGKERLRLQLHGFSDASVRAYAGVIYVRAFYSDTTVTTTLVLAKTKVAPLKPQTVPQLELRAADLLAKMLNQVSIELCIPKQDVLAWSDSTIVLHWLKSRPENHKVFVKNRVVAITSVVEAVRWHHVPTGDNPADVASRGCSAETLLSNKIWWEGPEWLRMDPSNWPRKQIVKPPSGADLQLVKRVAHVAVMCVAEGEIYQKYANYQKLIRIINRLYRFCENCHLGRDHTQGNRVLTAADLEDTENKLWKAQQMRVFADDYEALINNRELPKASPLKRLRPFLDKKGVMRVGGRLGKAMLAYEERHPAIISSKCILTKRLIEWTHVSCLHAGHSIVLNVLSGRVHIIGGRGIVKAVIRQCVTCRKATAHTEHQLMGQLPICRTQPDPAFTNTGVDYAGPLVIKRGYCRKPTYENCYVALFICMATKAVHIELVSDATTESFISALQCFVARRGKPAHLWSDNGPNFVGADTKLGNLYNTLRDKTESIRNFCTTERIKWHFIPPRSPHYGGLWEANIKSMKMLLQRHIGTHTLNSLELHNILCRIEAIMNSRPLLAMDSQPEDGIDVLTPAHFLIGRSLLALPVEPTPEHTSNRLKRYMLCDALEQAIWERWKREYLQSLQARQKWFKETNNLKCGDVVLIKDEALFVRTWPLGVVTETHPGSDGLVRAVTVRTSNGKTFRRAITKIVYLPTEEDVTRDDNHQDEPQMEPPPAGRGEDVQASSTSKT